MASTVKFPPPTDLEDLQRLPGYGDGFVRTERFSEAVAVLGPLLKILGPHLGRDPVMFAKVRIVEKLLSMLVPEQVASQVF